MKPVECFSELFDIRIADKEWMKELAFYIRYQVYAKEFGYEPLNKAERETDDFDAHSTHCLLIYKPTMRPVGCVRLVGMDPQRPEKQLPYELNCLSVIDKNLFNPDDFLPGQVIEFSRISVLEEFRRKVPGAENRYKGHVRSSKKVKGINIPVAPVSLFLASLGIMLSSDADYAVAMMEPKMVRLLRRFGMIGESIGESIDYHGWRAPYLLSRDDILKNLKNFEEGVGELYNAVNSSLFDEQPSQHWSWKHTTPEMPVSAAGRFKGWLEAVRNTAPIASPAEAS